MMDSDYLSAFGARLREARAKRYADAKSAAKAFGFNYNTYSQHERGRALPRRDQLARYAKAYHVSEAWLLTGDGEPGTARSKIVGKAGANSDGSILFAEADEIQDFAPVPPGGTDNSVAVEVAGFSMAGWVEHGSLIYYEDIRNPPTDDMLGSIVVVGLSTGEVLVKRLLRGSKRGRFDLGSAAGPVIHDAKVSWAAEITAIIPPRQAERIILRGGAL